MTQIFCLIRIYRLIIRNNHRNIAHSSPSIGAWRLYHSVELRWMVRRHHGFGLIHIIHHSPSWKLLHIWRMNGECINGESFFKVINNWVILTLCWRSFSASLAQNTSCLCSLSVFYFNWCSNLLSCAAINAFFPRAITHKPYVVDFIL